MSSNGFISSLDNCPALQTINIAFNVAYRQILVYLNCVMLTNREDNLVKIHFLHRQLHEVFHCSTGRNLMCQFDSVVHLHQVDCNPSSFIWGNMLLTQPCLLPRFSLNCDLTVSRVHKTWPVSTWQLQCVFCEKGHCGWQRRGGGFNCMCSLQLFPPAASSPQII